VTSKAIESPDKASEKAKQQPWRLFQNSDKTFMEYVDTENSAVLNTGIIIGYSITAAVDMARKHPDGPVEKALSAQPTIGQKP